MTKLERLERLLREANHLLLSGQKIDRNHSWFKDVEEIVGMSQHEGIKVREGSVARDGSCNFCHHYPPKVAKVWVLNGKTLEVRICPECLSDLKRAT